MRSGMVRARTVLPRCLTSAQMPDPAPGPGEVRVGLLLHHIRPGSAGPVLSPCPTPVGTPGPLSLATLIRMPIWPFSDVERYVHDNGPWRFTASPKCMIPLK